MLEIIGGSGAGWYVDSRGGGGRGLERRDIGGIGSGGDEEQKEPE